MAVRSRGTLEQRYCRDLVVRRIIWGEAAASDMRSSEEGRQGFVAAIYGPQTRGRGREAVVRTDTMPSGSGFRQWIKRLPRPGIPFSSRSRVDMVFQRTLVRPVKVIFRSGSRALHGIWRGRSRPSISGMPWWREESGSETGDGETAFGTVMRMSLLVGERDRMAGNRLAACRSGLLPLL